MIASSSLPSSTFTSFPLLPREIREEIWNHALPPPRLARVYTTCGEVHPFRNFLGRTAYTHGYAKKLAVPTILQICQESRIIGLQHYELAFDSNCRPSREKFPGLQLSELPVDIPFEKAMIYVDLERDVIVPMSPLSVPSPQTDPSNDMDAIWAPWNNGRCMLMLVIFEMNVPRSIYTWIRSFVFPLHRSGLYIQELLKEVVQGKRIVVIKGPFLLQGGGESLNDCVKRELIKISSMTASALETVGRENIRSFVDMKELVETLEREVLWDSVDDQAGIKVKIAFGRLSVKNF